jgi:molecular chaperone GrpE (heat shock protein)
MRDASNLKLTKWPFFAGNLLLLGTAGVICLESKLPLALWETALAAVCVAAGTALAVLPFILEYRTVAKLAEAGALASVMAQIQNLEAIAAQISGATGLWQNAQEAADKTAAAARSIADRMSDELKGFAEFMQRANDSEKATMRLEVEKLRRVEGDWLQVLVRMLDHVYALHAGALRSGQPSLIEQVGHFQNACRDTARRVGLTPFAAEPLEPFDPQRHQPLEGDGKPTETGTVAETIAVGYTFQGRLLRHALVRLEETAKDQPAPAAETLPPGEASV